MIIVAKDGRPSMRAVKSEMNNDCQLRIRRNLPKKKYFSISFNGTKFFKAKLNFPILEKVVIRWGTRMDISDISDNNIIVYNNIKALEKISNKKTTRELLFLHNKLTPLYTNSVILKIIDQNLDATYPVICRPLQHAKGKNFIVLNNHSELKSFVEKNGLDNFYFAPYIDKDAEFRVHCGLGKVLSILEKPRPDDPKTLAWNRSINNNPFVYVNWDKYERDLCLSALEALEIVKADFGAVDIIKKDGKFYVLEINSSPTLTSNQYTVEKYAQLFDFIHKFTTESKIKHWDFRKFKKASSFAWKNFQLNNNINPIQ